MSRSDPLYGRLPSHSRDARPAVPPTPVPPAPGPVPGTAQHPEYVPSCRVSGEMSPPRPHSPRTLSPLGSSGHSRPLHSWSAARPAPHEKPGPRGQMCGFHRSRWTQTTTKGTSDSQEGCAPGVAQTPLTFRWKKGPQGCEAPPSQVSRHLSSARTRPGPPPDTPPLDSPGFPTAWPSLKDRPHR